VNFLAASIPVHYAVIDEPEAILSFTYNYDDPEGALRDICHRERAPARPAISPQGRRLKHHKRQRDINHAPGRE